MTCATRAAHALALHGAAGVPRAPNPDYGSPRNHRRTSNTGADRDAWATIRIEQSEGATVEVEDHGANGNPTDAAEEKRIALDPLAGVQMTGAGHYGAEDDCRLHSPTITQPLGDSGIRERIEELLGRCRSCNENR